MMTGLCQITIADLDAVWAMKQEFLDEDGDVQPNAHTALNTLFRRSDFGRIFFITDRDKGPIGYCVLCFGFSLESGGRDAFVDEFFIESAHRGQGHGGRAIKLLVHEAAKLDVKKLFLEVAPENQSAQEIYKHAGFVPRSSYQLMQMDLSLNSK